MRLGRTHQIRVHTQYIGHSLVGDTLYGTHSPIISRQALHSYKVKFVHPITKIDMELSAKLPMDMVHILETYVKPITQIRL